MHPQARRRVHEIPQPRRRIYQTVFFAAAIYNLVLGLLMMAAPRFTIRLLQLPAERINDVAVMYWQGIALFVLLFAIGYFYCSREPERHAPIILMGTVGKLIGILGFINGWLIEHSLPGRAGVLTAMSDVLWLPFFLPFVFETIIQRRYEPR